MRMVLATSAHFDAAHYLPQHEGKCRGLHGHRWQTRIEIVLENTPPALLQLLGEDGMIVDFGDLKEAIQKYDHQDLNTFFENPTAEVVALSILAEVRDYLKHLSGVANITVWESPESSVTVSDMLLGTQGVARP